MKLISFSFYIFVSGVVLLYYILPRRFQWLILTLASVMFYATYGIEQFPLILLGTAIAYFAARWIQDIYDAPEGGSPAERKAKARGVLVWTAAALVILLVFVKAGGILLRASSACFKAAEKAEPFR